ncbi:MAG: hypothetical protein K1X29_05685 [Bdellovibrionales bacterium]|nr:hypothetical protein [Bdellovibrionales bacterium]
MTQHPWSPWAAAYLSHLVKNHALNDGNKGIAAITTVVFLEAYELQVIAKEDEFEPLVKKAAHLH